MLINFEETCRRQLNQRSRSLLVLDGAKDATVKYKCPKLANMLGVQEDSLKNKRAK